MGGFEAPLDTGGYRLKEKVRSVLIVANLVQLWPYARTPHMHVPI